MQTIDLIQHDGPTVFCFWATWCSPCKRELDAVSDFYEELQDEYDVELLAITIDDARSLAKVPALVETKGWEYTILADYALSLDLWQEGVQARWCQGENWVSAAPGGISRQFNKALYQEEKRMKSMVLKPGLAKALLSPWLALKARWKRA